MARNSCAAARAILFAALASSCSSSAATLPPAAAPSCGTLGRSEAGRHRQRADEGHDRPARRQHLRRGRRDDENNVAVEHSPKTDEDWERIRIGATTLAEGVYLLKMVRPFAPIGDVNNSTGPDATELSPAQILVKLEKDPVEWNARIETLRNVGLEVLDIVKRKDVNELWDAGENLDAACENCHRSYWYPGETPEFYSRLDRRLSETYPAKADQASRGSTTVRSTRNK